MRSERMRQNSGGGHGQLTPKSDAISKKSPTIVYLLCLSMIFLGLTLFVFTGKQIGSYTLLASFIFASVAGIIILTFAVRKLLGWLISLLT
jgi:hypothetical protein